MWRLLILLALLQAVLSSPVSPCEKLEIFLSHEITTLGRRALSEAADLLQRVIDEAERIGPTDGDRVVLDEFAAFIEGARHDLDSEELVDFLEELMDLLELDGVEVSSESAGEDEESLVEKLVRQYGFDKFERNLERELQMFMRRIEDHIETYLRRRNGQSSQMPTWFTDFRNETDIETKYMKLGDLMDRINC